MRPTWEPCEERKIPSLFLDVAGPWNAPVAPGFPDFSNPAPAPAQLPPTPTWIGSQTPWDTVAPTLGNAEVDLEESYGGLGGDGGGIAGLSWIGPVYSNPGTSPTSTTLDPIGGNGSGNDNEDLLTGEEILYLLIMELYLMELQGSDPQLLWDLLG